MPESQKIAVIGLGSMGYGIAKSCLRDGHQTFGSDIDLGRMRSFQEEGGLVGDLNKFVSVIDAVVVVVLNAEQTRQVLFGDEGIVQNLKTGAVVISCATVPPDFAIEMERCCAEHNVHYLDAPISGGAKKANSGDLTVMASGSLEAFQAAKPVLDATAETVFELGNTAGPGSAMKAVNQLLAGVHIATMAEALTFGMTQGVTPEKFIEVISNCAGTSWMLENRAPHIAQGDYTPHSQINIWPKDLGIVLDIAKSAQFSAPITAVALQQFVAAAGMGLGSEDDAAVAKVYARNADLKLPGEN